MNKNDIKRDYGGKSLGKYSAVLLWRGQYSLK